MSHNSFGQLFRITTWGESHGPAIGCVVDGCPPRIGLTEADIQPFLDRRRPGQSKFVTQRQEPDAVRILSGVFEGLTTGTPRARTSTTPPSESRSRLACSTRATICAATSGSGQRMGLRSISSSSITWARSSPIESV